MILFALILATLPPATGSARADVQALERTTESNHAARWALDEILVALRVVETGGVENGGRRAVGDGGKAIGPYQIHRDYWLDSGLPGRFEDCCEPRYARRVVLAYWRRYCPKALESLDAETLTRIHNGGPTGHKKEATKVFWRKVERELARQREKNQRGTLA